MARCKLSVGFGMPNMIYKESCIDYLRSAALLMQNSVSSIMGIKIDDRLIVDHTAGFDVQGMANRQLS